jgi:hypothetical protein
MMATMIVDVTQSDIDEGERLSFRKCPVATALSRATGRVCVVDGWHWWFARTITNRPLPDLAERFIFDFDNWRPVFPFRFEIAV